MISDSNPGNRVSDASAGVFLPVDGMLPFPWCESIDISCTMYLPTPHKGERSSDGLQISDYELLDELIFSLMPGVDSTDALVSQLMRRFGSLAAVLSAAVEDLTEEIKNKPVLIVYLKLAWEVARRSHLAKLKTEGILKHSRWLYAYLRVVMAQESIEQARILFFDSTKRLLTEELTWQGTVDSAPIYPREVVRSALRCKARYVVLSHNHPSGDPSPSTDDIVMTRRIVEAASLMNITVLDHIIVGKSRLFSMYDEGLL